MRRRLSSALLAGVALLAGCGGEAPGEAPGERPPPDVIIATCTATSECNFGERCQNGVCTSEVPPLVTPELCASDADCAQGEACAPSSGRCVPLVAEPTPTPDPTMACASGETRRCGNKLGACEYGLQTCVDGAWDPSCVGEVLPAAESCNGADDDCDGVVPEGELDPDADGVRACAGDCAPADGSSWPGAPELCDGRDNDCDGALDDGAAAACDDGLYCNGVESCSQGACVPGADIDCSSLDGTCHRGACSEAARDCVAEVASDGTFCDDGDHCTLSTTCSSGTCGGGSARDCSAQNDPCNRGVCDSAQAACVKEPYTDNRACDDGLYCTLDDSCVAGRCEGGSPRPCADVSFCRAGACDEDADACTSGSPIREGEGCDDGLYCTEGEVCTSGGCAGGQPRSCATLADQCNAGVCNESQDACQRQPYTDGRTCSDGAFCTVGDACGPGGTCAGSPRDCSSRSDACNLGVCNEGLDLCEPQPRNEGGACSDGAFCTVGDACIAGGCVGTARNCAAVADGCNLGVCNETADACQRSPRADGTSCDDALFCTTGDRCQGGACSGPTARDCSALDDPPCFVGSCSEAQDQCLAFNPGTCGCDPAVDADGDGVDSCADCDETDAGVYPGAPERCNGLDDDCDSAVPAGELDGDGDGVRACAGDCAPDIAAIHPGAAEDCDGVDDDCDGTPDDGASATCDDGLLCNGVESCSAGACAPGVSLDCSGLTDGCNVGACSEVAGECVAVPRSDGTPCTDADFCTVSTTCTAGVCGGGAARDCSAQADPCNAGVCDSASATCKKQPYVDNRACNDGQYCTVGDTCQAGACQGGAARSCPAVSSCRGGACDEASDACVAGPPINQGVACDDGQYCTVGEVCTSGSCGQGTPRSCAALADQCSAGVCNEASDACQKQPYADGRTCSDGAFCTSGDTCQPSGACLGGARDCSSLTDPCNLGVCNETADACQRQARNEGGGCSDGLYCTTPDVCAAGTCGGAPRSCSASADACNTGVCSESQDACQKSPRPNGTSCDDGQYCTVSDRCQSGACQSGAARDCSGLDDPPCIVGTCSEAQDQCVAVDPGTCGCDPDLDADFDGADSCADCDDTNGSVHPSALERCNGLDDDCDGRIDETFDVDGDGYSVCAPVLAERDCDDTRATVHPGALEACGASNTGNGLDDDCDGYIDESCAPCSATDGDGDGYSACQGDCAPSDGAMAPGKPELCDGKDNDCNAFTTENCGVSEPCNWPSGADTCEAELLCACAVNAAGNCNGNYLCTSLCNNSVTGAVGDGCGVGQTCYYDLLRSANVHGCAAVDATLGQKLGGVACASDAECRSGYCEQLFVGPGQQTYCSDYCGGDAHCAGSAVCRAVRSSSNFDGRCWPTGRPGLGTKVVGQGCTQDSECDHGVCTTVSGSTTRVCTEPCCSDGDCGAGFTCSLAGDQVTTGYVYLGAAAPSCTTTAQCPSGMECYTASGLCAWRMSETTPMCVADLAGQGLRRAGAACSQNSDCQSAFCERSLGVCVESCCSSAGCPEGTACEYQVVQTTSDRVSQARVCVNQSSGEVYLRK